jgi:protein involved in polysaccharide export with SLBB domain
MEKSVVVRGAVYGVGVHGLRTSTLTVEQTRTSEGNYELEKGDRVSDILTKAGGIAPWADLAHGYLERFDPERATVTRRKLDLSKIISGRGSGEDIFLMDRDVLVVPSLEDKIYVNGGVYNPGPFDYQPNLTVMDYVGLAGGATPRGNLKKTLVLRPDGTRTPAPMGAASPVLHRGDTILVPEVALKWWQDYVTLLTAVSSVVISWLIIAE